MPEKRHGPYTWYHAARHSRFGVYIEPDVNLISKLCSGCVCGIRGVQQHGEKMSHPAGDWQLKLPCSRALRAVCKGTARFSFEYTYTEPSLVNTILGSAVSRECTQFVIFVRANVATQSRLYELTLNVMKTVERSSPNISVLSRYLT